jgi:two-component system, LuxR family, response regulator FixJ
MMTNEKSVAEIVCLVDDDPAVLKSVARLLASDGFSVRAFSEPMSFLDHVQTYRVPVVILDIWMEQMNGLEVQAHLCALSPETKVIIITASRDAAAERIAMQAGAFGFFHKPFDDEEFLAAVRDALDE